MTRNVVGLPLIVFYMLALLLAAWPKEIRPVAFDAAHDVAYSTLWSVGILPGLSVFRGQIAVKEYAIRFRCVVASGTNANGERELIYPSDPSDPCPTTGLRWKPETYRHMFFHWVWFIDDALTPWNLWAMADHFCHLSPVTCHRIANSSPSELSS